MPIGVQDWLESSAPIEYPEVSDFASGAGQGFADPGAGASPTGSPYVRVSPTEDFDTGLLPIGAVAVMVIPEDDSRRTIQLRNYSTDDVFIARSESQLNEDQGWPIAQDERLLLETRHAVWAKCAAGNSSILAVLAEYERDIVSS